MPAFGEVGGGAVVDFVGQPPVIKEINSGSANDFAVCENVIQRTGIRPSEALITYRNVKAKDEAGPITLDSNEIGIGSIKMFTRIQIEHSGATIFIGEKTNRNEKGNQNILAFTYEDDKHYLQDIPIRGALVRDPYTGNVVFSPKYHCIMNPHGVYNCCSATYNGFDGDVFVFSPMGNSALNDAGLQAVASAKAALDKAQADLNTANKSGSESAQDAALDAYSSAKAAYNSAKSAQSNDSAGVSVPWTAERAIKYFRLLAQFDAGSKYPEIKAGNIDSNKILWPDTSFNDADMTAKMPETPFRGEKVLGALVKILAISGKYDLVLNYANGKSIITFPAKVSSSGVSLALQRSGKVSDVKSIHDFEINISAKETQTGVVVEGDVIRIETSFSYDPADPDGVTSSTLIRGWTKEDRTNFNLIIDGKDGTNAYGPLNPGDLPATWKNCDGTGGMPKILRRTNEARKLARAIFPNVLRAFKIAGGDDTGGGAAVDSLLDGFNNAYANVPRIQNNKPIDDVQLSFYQETNTANKNTRGKLRFPTRVRVNSSDLPNTFIDCELNNGLRCEPDGLIYLSGLTDDQGDSESLIYEGSLAANPSTVFERKIKLNAYIQHDMRIYGYRDIMGANNNDPNSIAGQCEPSIAGRKQAYFYNPESFQQEERINSQPTGYANLSGVIHSDTGDLAAAVNRKLAQRAKFAKNAHIRLPGIRTDLAAGTFISDINFQGTGGTYKLYQLCTEIKFDFAADKRETVLSCDNNITSRL